MSEEALLLTNGGPARENIKVAKVLRFFGVPARELRVGEFQALTSPGPERPVRYRIFCSSDTFARLIGDLEESPERIPRWQENVHSTFVYAGAALESLEKVARVLTGDAGAMLAEMAGRPGDFVVSRELPEFCRAMSGVRVAAPEAIAGTRVALHTSHANSVKIISIGASASFLRLQYQKTEVFLSTSGDILDIDTELANGVFDVRAYFLSAVPLVLYIKWAFPQTCWSAVETNACLVIDDPVLKPRYGFIRFRDLLGLMKRHGFSSNVAFIPWNWRRTDAEVARLFRENAREYSLSIHGCDHTRGEFGCAAREQLYRKATRAVERMARHEASTGIAHDRVMVFPQGAFSEAAMSALKHTDLIAAVNNDTISVDPHPRAIRIADGWDVAVMAYSNFSLFTRRYPWEGLENFAFDSLLGKPAISVIHHDFCGDGYVRLLEFVQGLNSLSCHLTWRSLAEVLRRSFRQRQIRQGLIDIEMYAAELLVENGSNDTRTFRIGRHETDPSLIKDVRAGSRQVPWAFADGRLSIGLDLRSRERLIVRVEYHNLSEEGRTAETMSAKLQTMVRRYLCEARDNYASKLGPSSRSPFFKVN